MTKEKEYILIIDVMYETHSGISREISSWKIRLWKQKLCIDAKKFIWREDGRKRACQHFLEKYTWNNLLVRSIISIDEFWIRSYYPIEESSAYKLNGASPPRKKKITLSDWKRMVIVACYQGQVIAYTLVPEKTTVDGLFFLNFLKSKVFPEIKKKKNKISSVYVGWCWCS